MSKTTQRAIEFAKNPPVFVTFTPVDYMIYETRQTGLYDCVKESGVRCDPMEKNDPAVLLIEPTVWLVTRCVQGGADRYFGITGNPSRYRLNGRPRFVLWRVPYRWRPAVAKLEGHGFESREALEAAMRATVEQQ